MKGCKRSESDALRPRNGYVSTSNKVKMKSTKLNEKTNKWFPEIEWLASKMEKFNSDHFKILCERNEKDLPEPASNISNILRSARAAGLIEALPEYRKSDWKGSSRVPRQYWRRPKSRKEK